ncbi:MAG TPA: hypothetical protein VKZ63_09120, partial [Kofleriaceae bacterium]|nr:hypothetical protein [Kofleriaceae bacterium]
MQRLAGAGGMERDPPVARAPGRTLCRGQQRRADAAPREARLDEDGMDPGGLGRGVERPIVRSALVQRAPEAPAAAAGRRPAHRRQEVGAVRDRRAGGGDQVTDPALDRGAGGRRRGDLAHDPLLERLDDGDVGRPRRTDPDAGGNGHGPPAQCGAHLDPP